MSLFQNKFSNDYDIIINLIGYINGKSIKENLETGREMSSKIIQIIGARLS